MIPEHAVPYPRHGRMWDDTLSGIQRLRRVDFLLGLGLDPARVPDGARIEHDARTDEYRLQVINPGGHLVWVRRLWFPPPRPRRLPALTEDLMALRDRYAHPYADRHLDPAPFARGGLITEGARAAAAAIPAIFDACRPLRTLAEVRGAPADVVIIDDPGRPSVHVTIAAAATADRWYNEMRAGRA